MSLTLTPVFLLFLVVVVIVSGMVNGLAGFGFAVVGTMALAAVVDPASAVILMIIPMLAANLTLVSELTGDELRTCGRRFGPLMLSALIGTIVGMVILDLLPEGPLRIGLGLLTLAFVAGQQQAVQLPTIGTDGGSTVTSTPAMLTIGGLSGLLFGATNVGVQLVAYLKSQQLSHGLFVGVVAMVFVGINAIRVGAAGLLGLYPTLSVFGLSVLMVIPAIGGVAVGSRLRNQVSSRIRRRVVLGLLILIGIRLLLGGLGIA